MTAVVVDLPDDVLAWIEELTDRRIVAARRVPGGARREAWFVDVAPAGSDGGEALFLRYDRSGAAAACDPWTVERETTVFRALQGTDVPVPRVLGLHPDRRAMLSERVTGATWFSRITDPAEALATASDFMGHLAALHRVAVDDLDLPGFPRPTDVPSLVRHELDELDAVLAHRGGEVDAGLRLTLDWLRANVPTYEGPAVLVQGDTGPGNFLYDDGRVVAIVDWELAHLGDPMDDLAWLSLRATQEPFTHLPDRLREYEALSGHVVDDDRIRYYRVMAEAKLLVMGHGDRNGAVRLDPKIELVYGLLHRRLWLDALADVLDLEQFEPLCELRQQTDRDRALAGEGSRGLLDRTWPPLR